PAGDLLPLTWLRAPGERTGADLIVVGEPSPRLEEALDALSREGLRARFLPGSPVAAIDAVAGGLADAAVVGPTGEVEARGQGLVVRPFLARRVGLAARVGAPLEAVDDARAALVQALGSGARL